ncbi:MAG: hypothetical protein M0R32_02505 [Candidatus Cloacimonetes bacterium]|jgi:hypothetical protein|nr:hypothetical protein [Candidatus Cloacimonadota bacterium]
MKIRFIKACEVDMAVGTGKDGEPVFETEAFKVGEEFDVDVVDFATTADPNPGGNGFIPNRNWPQLEFGDGSISTGIPLECFEIIEGQEEFDKAFEDAISEDAVDDAVIDANEEEKSGEFQDLER